MDWTGSKYYYNENVTISLWGTTTGDANTVRTTIQDNGFIALFTRWYRTN